MRIVRILQSISVVSLVSAIAIFIFCIVQWAHGRYENELDTGYSIVEEFRQQEDENNKIPHQVVPPLVKQARAFALYLNPLQSEKPIRAQRIKPAVKRHVKKVKRPKGTPKFTLLATSYYRAVPEESLALVSEPGKEARWIKQGESLGHFVLAKIEKGKIFYRNGDKLEVMAMNTKAPIYTEYVRKTTLASSQTRKPRPKSSTPDKPQKAGPRRTIKRLGPHAKLSM